VTATPPVQRSVAIAGASAISRYGATWRGLARALSDGGSFPGVPAETPLANPKARNARKMMSRGAYLAAAALAELMREVGWSAAQREGAGYYLGVGASGGSLDDVTALLDASIVDNHGTREFSTVAFGEHGLAACNPLLAFQLMNNFTLAHGAIFEGLGGPNGALFSRGSGTTAALIEAVHAIASGDCERAIAGGADSATHPVTAAELAREGFTAHGLEVAEGAGLLALVEVAQLRPSTARLGGNDAANLGSVEAAHRSSPDVIQLGSVDAAPSASLGVEVHAQPILVTGCAIACGRGRDLGATIADAIARATEAAAAVAELDVVVIAGWGPPAVDASRTWARTHAPRARIVDVAALGATLAAGPALGWIAALDLLAASAARRVLVIDAGVDGDAGAALFERGGAA